MDRSTQSTNVEGNIELVVQAGELMRSGFVDREGHPFADDFVFHYINPQLPDLDGDYHGFDGIADLFERLGVLSEAGFHNEPHSLTPCGDELLVAFATNTVGFDGTVIDVDAVVVWRVFGGRIHEAWDIPAVNTVRPHPPEA
ncbi:MAG: nuclear transport factor 2 family protein [Acidimicrobiales bacterium]